MHSFVTPGTLSRMGWSHRDVSIDHQLAEEMIFDADETGVGKLSLDSLIACIEMVGVDEEYEAS